MRTSILTLKSPNDNNMKNSEMRIQKPHRNDVLCGRGGGINAHPGNKKFRDWVNERKEAYNLAANKNLKTKVAQEVIQLIRQQNPPGKFLARGNQSTFHANQMDGYWIEVDETKALAKTSQALREGAPKIRAQHGVVQPVHPSTALSFTDRNTSANLNQQQHDNPKPQHQHEHEHFTNDSTARKRQRIDRIPTSPLKPTSMSNITEPCNPPLTSTSQITQKLHGNWKNALETKSVLIPPGSHTLEDMTKRKCSAPPPALIPEKFQPFKDFASPISEATSPGAFHRSHSLATSEAGNVSDVFVDFSNPFADDDIDLSVTAESHPFSSAMF